MAAGSMTQRAAITLGLTINPLRTWSIVACVFVIAALVLGWFRLLTVPTHSVVAVRQAAAPEVLTVFYALGGGGLEAGDVILAVDNVPAALPEAESSFLRQRERGEEIRLTVQRQSAPGTTEALTIPFHLPVTQSTQARMYVLGTIWALFALATPVLVALARPREPASAPLLFSGVLTALSTPGVLLGHYTGDLWHVGVRLSFALPAVATAGLIHMFLVFPAPHPLVLRLRRWGPAWLRRRGGATFVVYALPAGLVLLAESGPPATMGGSIGILALGVLTAVVLAIQSYRRAQTPFVRPQLRWVFLGMSVSWSVMFLNLTLDRVLGMQPPLVRSIFYVAMMMQQISMAVAVLRFGMFDVARVVRQTVNYVVLAGILVGAYVAITLAASRAFASVMGPDAQDASTIQVVTAVGLAVAAMPLQRRLSRVLDVLVYRAREARRLFLERATLFLGRAQPLDALLAFMTNETSQRLELAGAWLALPASLRAAGDDRSPAPAEPLIARFARADGPVLLAEESGSIGGVETLAATDPVVTPWYQAGARLIVPLRAASGDDSGGGLIGVWALGGPRSGDLPERDDLDAFARVGGQAAVLLDYARLHGEQVHQALVQQDLERARQIQQKLLPPPRAEIPGCLEVVARLQPARETSGDFFDYMAFGDGADGGARGLQIAVGDVQGKGIGAALVMALAAASLRTAAVRPTDGGARVTPSPAGTLGIVGRQLNRTVGARDFVCCALAVVDVDGAGSAWLRLSNAGQNPPLLCRDGDARDLEPDGDRFPLGVLAGSQYREIELPLAPGDVVVFSSDGLTEAPAAESAVGSRWEIVPPPTREGEFFGFDRLRALSASLAARRLEPEGILNGLWSELERWCGGDFQHDDMTLVVLRVASREDAGG